METVVQTIQGMRFRWLNTQCYQMVLPDGTSILTDPTLRAPRADKPQYQKYLIPGFKLEDLGRVDYIILNHTHFDHCPDVGAVYEMYKPMIIIHTAVAYELGLHFNIPLTSIYPVDFDQRYYLPDFILETYHGMHKHRPKVRPQDTFDAAGDIYDDVGDCKILGDHLGSLFNLNFIIQSKQNIRVGFGAGADHVNLMKKWEDAGINILLRHISTKNAEDIDRIKEILQWAKVTNAQIIMPLHHEPLVYKKPREFDHCVELCNEALQKEGLTARMINPIRTKWYTLSTRIETTDII